APVLLETSSMQQFEPNLKRHGLDPELYLGAMDPNGIMPWSLVSTGVPEWYLKQEFGRSRGLGGGDVPVLDLPAKAAALVEPPGPRTRGDSRAGRYGVAATLRHPGDQLGGAHADAALRGLRAGPARRSSAAGRGRGARRLARECSAGRGRGG